MRIVLIATLTADGFIAQTSDQLVDWSGKADKALFVRVTKQLGTMVMGARTFATIGRALPGRRTIVLTHHPERITAAQVETSAETPAELVKRLKSAGAAGLAICGGADIYTQFMQAGLVEELYLVTEPLVFGRGVSLFTEAFTQRFELIDSQAQDGSVINHYRFAV